MSDLGYLPDELRSLSASDREIVLPYPEVLEAIDVLRDAGIEQIGWEGWLVYDDGRKGHSGTQQGTSSAFEFEPLIRTIKVSSSEYAANPEREDAQLYYCLWFRDPVPDVPPARERQLAAGQRLLQLVLDAVEGAITAHRSGVQVDLDWLNAQAPPQLWIGALERLTQMYVHGQDGWRDDGAWLDGTYVTRIEVAGDVVILECIHDYVSGRDEWLKTLARYELRLPPGECAVGYGGRDWAGDNPHQYEFPASLEVWPWRARFSLEEVGT